VWNYKTAYKLKLNKDIIKTHPANERSEQWRLKQRCRLRISYMLGSFIGTKDYIVSSLNSKINRLGQLLATPLTIYTNRQDRLLLLRRYYILKLNHLFRTISVLSNVHNPICNNTIISANNSDIFDSDVRYKAA
jgi:hypothetical protein